MASHYDAFISYAHDKDMNIADVLQTALERFAKPWHQLQAVNLYRDVTDLAAEPITPAIESALKKSNYLILLASPEASESKWVQREVGLWLELNKLPADILIAQTGGAKLAWDHDAGDFYWDRVDALPPNLKGVFKADPLRSDLRWARDEPNLSTADIRLQGPVTQIAARLRGCSPDELIGENLLLHRRALRQAGAAIAALALLLILAGLLSINLNWTLDRVNLSNSQLFAGHSENAYQDQDRELTALLSHAAFDSADSPAARRALLQSIAEGPIATLGRGEPPTRDATLFSDCRAEIVDFGFQSPTAAIQDVAFSPDGTFVVSVDTGDVIRLWRLTETESPMRQISAEGQLKAVAFSADGESIITGGTNGLSRWDAATLETGCLINKRDVTSLAIMPDGETVLFGDTMGNVIQTDLDGQESVTITDAPAATSVIDVAVAENGSFATGRADGVVLIWNAKSVDQQAIDALTYTSGTSAIATTTKASLTSLCLSPDGAVLVAGYSDGAIVFWDAQTQAQIGTALRQGGGAIEDLTFSLDGRLLATAGGSGDVVLRETSKWSEVRTLKSLGSVHATSAEFSPDGSRLASGNHNGATLLWSSAGPPLGQELKDIGIKEVTAIGLALNSDVMSFVVGGPNEALQHCTIADKALSCDALSWSDNDVRALAFSSYRDRLAIEKGDGTITVSSLSGDQELLTSPDGFAVASLAFSGDGSILAATGAILRVRGTMSVPEPTILLWDLASGQGPVQQEIQAEVTALAFSPTNSLLVAAGENLVVGLTINKGTPPNQRVFPVSYATVNSLAFAPNGKRFASGNTDGSVTVWESSGHLYWEATKETTDRDSLSVAFSSDGRYLASGNSDGSILVWDVDQKERIGVLGVLKTAIVAVDWLDPRVLLAIDHAGSAVELQTDPNVWKERACSVAGRDFLPEEARRYFGSEDYGVCQDFFGLQRAFAAEPDMAPIAANQFPRPLGEILRFGSSSDT